MENIESEEPSDDQNDLSKAQKKEQKINEERVALLNHLSSFNLKTIRDKVAYILNNNKEARNSDRALCWDFWTRFESEHFDGRALTESTFYKVTPMNNLIRERARIQNDYKLFQADAIVQTHRKTLSSEQRAKALEEKPSDIGSYVVYMDESGKNDPYISVGSLWVLESDISLSLGTLDLVEWKKSKNFKSEFHFTKMSKNELNIYKEFFDKFYSMFPTISFKGITLKNIGVKSGTAIADLTYFLISKGIDYEVSTSRAPLPRRLQVWIDKEEEGSDTLKLELVKDRLAARKLTGLYFDEFQAVESQNNFFIQAVDLFTGAVNRRINPSSTRNHKDELSDYILEALDFELSDANKENDNIDNAVMFELSKK